MAANMDVVGTFKMHDALTEFHMVTCIAKALNLTEDWWKVAYMDKGREFLGCLAGISEDEMDRVIEIWNSTRMSFIGIDVANGQSQLLMLSRDLEIKYQMQQLFVVMLLLLT